MTTPPSNPNQPQPPHPEDPQPDRRVYREGVQDPNNPGAYRETYEEYDERTPIHKNPLFWILILAALAAIGALAYFMGKDDGESSAPTTSVVQVIEETTEAVPAAEPDQADPAVTQTETVVNEVRETVVEQQPAPAPESDTGDEEADRNQEALSAANGLLNNGIFSKQGLFDELTSQEGGAFPQEAAQFAVDNVDVDWNNAAVRAAGEIRAENPEISDDELKDMLTDDNEWKFTDEEAQYALDNS